MALKISDECINCDACVSECPNTAIYEPDEEWTYADGTKLEGDSVKPSGEEFDASKENDTLSEEFYFEVNIWVEVVYFLEGMGPLSLSDVNFSDSSELAELSMLP